MLCPRLGMPHKLVFFMLWLISTSGLGFRFDSKPYGYILFCRTCFHRPTAYLHWRSRIQTRTWTRIPNPMGTLYYAEVFTLVKIQIQIPTRMDSWMVTVSILGMDLCPRERYLSQFYYISIRDTESESEPMRNFCIINTVIRVRVQVRIRVRQCKFARC